MKTIQPYLIGSGAAARAIEKSLAILSILYPQWGISSSIHLKRDEKLSGIAKSENSVLFLANPHALHAPRLLEAESAGFKWVMSEKPVAVDQDQVQSLKQIKIPVGVFHGYRQTWGIQTIKKMLDSGELGDWFSIEGRYWQSSVAEKKVSGNQSTTWKDDESLSGKYDVLLDLGTHWTDLVFYLAGQLPVSGEVHLSRANSSANHRDTSNWIQMDFGRARRAFGSISKTTHGFGNDLEIHVFGERKALSWSFLDPDKITVGEGSTKSVLVRHEMAFGSEQWPFHGTGWLEGYVEIIKQYFRQMRGEPYQEYPDLKGQVKVLNFLFQHLK